MFPGTSFSSQKFAGQLVKTNIFCAVRYRPMVLPRCCLELTRITIQPAFFAHNSIREAQRKTVGTLDVLESSAPRGKRHARSQTKPDSRDAGTIDPRVGGGVGPSKNARLKASAQKCNGQVFRRPRWGKWCGAGPWSLGLNPQWTLPGTLSVTSKKKKAAQHDLYARSACPNRRVLRRPAPPADLPNRRGSIGLEAFWPANCPADVPGPKLLNLNTRLRRTLRFSSTETGAFLECGTFRTFRVQPNCLVWPSRLSGGGDPQAVPCGGSLNERFGSPKP